jgi:hypothetical protein
MGQTDGAAEDGWIGVDLFQIFRDRPTVGDDAAVIAQNRHKTLSGKGDRFFLGEAPGNGFDWQTLMRQGEPGAPAKGAEPEIRVRAREIVEDHGHASAPTFPQCPAHPGTWGER